MRPQKQSRIFEPLVKGLNILISYTRWGIKNKSQDASTSQQNTFTHNLEIRFEFKASSAMIGMSREK